MSIRVRWYLYGCPLDPILDCSYTSSEHPVPYLDVPGLDQSKTLHCHDLSTIVIEHEKTSGDFNATWNVMREGFSEFGETYLGNEAFHYMTSSNRYKMRIDLWLPGDFQYAEFDSVVIGTEADRYALSVSGFQTGTAGAGGFELYHDGVGFSTYDNDLTANDRTCVHDQYGAAYWHRATGTIPIDVDGTTTQLSECYSTLLTGYNHIFWRREDPGTGTMGELELVDKVAMRIQTDLSSGKAVSLDHVIVRHIFILFWWFIARFSFQ